MTTEPPKGLRANLLRLYNTLTEEGYAQCKAAAKYQKLVFALSYFHRCVCFCGGCLGVSVFVCDMRVSEWHSDNSIHQFIRHFSTCAHTVCCWSAASSALWV